MLRKNKLNLALSCIVLLLPMVFGIIMWDSIPPTVTTHWGADGAADGWSGRGFAVFGLPLIILALHILCLLITFVDNKKTQQSHKVIGMVMWIWPMISVFANGLMYSAILGLNPGLQLIPALLGLMFVILGNYMPKFRRNHTMGIRLPWTLASDENWSHTHRIGGITWVAAGAAQLGSVFLPQNAMLIVCVSALLASLLIPAIYSFALYKKQIAGGEDISLLPTSSGSKAGFAIGMLILAGAAFLMFSGDITYEYGEDSFTVDSWYGESIEVDYAAIDSIELIEDDTGFERIFGFASARLQLGTYSSDRLGEHTRYTYTTCKSCVVLSIDGRTLVLGGATADDTEQIYEALTEKMEA